MLFAKLFVALFALPLLAVATPWGSPPPTTVTVTATPTATTVSQCNTGSIQCCNSVQPASSAAASKILGLLGIVLNDLDVLVGLDCSPVLDIVGQDECNAQPVCCTGDNFSGLIVIGCSPITL